MIYNAETGYENIKFRGVSKSTETDGADTPVLDAIFTRDSR